MSLQEAPLYGGAIVTKLPASRIDVSQIRDVPDNQEVFILEGETPANDESIIVDLIERVDKPTEEIIHDITGDLLQNAELVQVPMLLEEFQNDRIGAPALAFYTQVAEGLVVVVAVVRLESVKTDVVVSWNYRPDTSEAVSLEDGKFQQVLQSVRQVARDFEVKDYSLFG